VNVLENLIAANQMDPYDFDSSDGPSEISLQSTVPEPLPFNDPNYETYKHSQQFLIVDHTANLRNGSEASKIWQHGGERRRVDDGTMDRYWRCGHCINKRILKCLETGKGGSEVDSFNSRINGKVNTLQQRGRNLYIRQSKTFISYYITLLVVPS